MTAFIGFALAAYATTVLLMALSGDPLVTEHVRSRWLVAVFGTVATRALVAAAAVYGIGFGLWFATGVAVS